MCHRLANGISLRNEKHAVIVAGSPSSVLTVLSWLCRSLWRLLRPRAIPKREPSRRLECTSCYCLKEIEKSWLDVLFPKRHTRTTKFLGLDSSEQMFHWNDPLGAAEYIQSMKQIHQRSLGLLTSFPYVLNAHSEDIVDVTH